MFHLFMWKGLFRFTLALDRDPLDEANLLVYVFFNVLERFLVFANDSTVVGG